MRVSRMLEVCGLVDAWWFTEVARERGRLVHLISESVLRGLPVAVAPEYQGYHDALVRALAPCPFRPVFIEQRVHAWGKSGRPDAVGYLREPVGAFPAGPCILDFKSGLKLPSHAIQLALYELLVDANHQLRAVLPSAYRQLPWLKLGLYVTARGTFKWVRYQDDADRECAKCVINIVNWRLSHGLLIESDPVAGSQQPDDPAVPV